MKIIISPSKEMLKDKPVDGCIEYKDKTKKIIEYLCGLSRPELKKIYKVSDKILDDISLSLADFYGQDSFQAGDLYNGIAFRNMKLRNLSGSDKEFIRDKLFILSALYGPIRITDPIKAYRLDFNTKLKIDSMSLKKLWEDDFNMTFDKGETILNLASDEFSSLFHKENYSWIDFDFYEINEGKEKKHSMISKKARGSMVRFIIENKVEKLQELKNFNLDGYRFMEDKSTSNYFVYARKK